MTGKFLAFKPRSWFALLALGLSAAAMAVAPGTVVKNFKLNDQAGQAHELYAVRAKAVVLMIQGNGCPIVRLALPTLAEIRKEYANKGVEFLLLNSNLQDNQNSIAEEAKEFSIDFPILVDQSQNVGEALGVQRTSEIFLIDTQTHKLLYRGPIDDRLSYETQRPAKNHFLQDALNDTLAGKPVRVPSAAGVGCIVNFPERDKKRT